MYFGEGRYFKCFFLFVKMILCYGVYHTSKSSVYQIYIEDQSSKMYLLPSLKQKEKPYRCLRCHCDPLRDSALRPALRRWLLGFVFMSRSVAANHFILPSFALYIMDFCTICILLWFAYLSHHYIWFFRFIPVATWAYFIFSHCWIVLCCITAAIIFYQYNVWYILIFFFQTMFL